MARTEGLSREQICDGLASFQGSMRRFQVQSAPGAAITIIDDYAHHPTAAVATIEAARQHFPGRRLIAVYRPHTYSRTLSLLPEYRAAFAGADLTYITDIEGAREAHLEASISGRDIVDGGRGTYPEQDSHEV